MQLACTAIITVVSISSLVKNDLACIFAFFSPPTSPFPPGKNGVRSTNGDRFSKRMSSTTFRNSGESTISEASPFVFRHMILSIVIICTFSFVLTHSRKSGCSNSPPIIRSPRAFWIWAEETRNFISLDARTPSGSMTPCCFPLLSSSHLYTNGPRPKHPGDPTLGPLMLTDDFALTESSSHTKSARLTEIPAAAPVS